MNKRRIPVVQAVNITPMIANESLCFVSFLPSSPARPTKPLFPHMEGLVCIAI